MLFVGCFLLSIGLQAQVDVPILLTKTHKKVKYAPEQGARFSKVEATKSLDPGGVLKLRGKSKARLYCNGTFKELEGKGNYAVAELFEDELRYAPMGFSNVFNDRLMAAIGGSKGSDTMAVSSGWGNKKFDIISQTPIGKTTAGQPLTFRWQSKEEFSEYAFTIEDESGKTLYSATVGKKQHTVNPSEQGLTAGMAYTWRVTQPGENGASSNKFYFSIVDEAEKAEVMKALQEEEAYQQADPLMKKLMEAAYLEDAEFYYAADEAYEAAARMEGEGGLPEEMHKAFVRRRQRDE